MKKNLFIILICLSAVAQAKGIKRAPAQSYINSKVQKVACKLSSIQVNQEFQKIRIYITVKDQACKNTDKSNESTAVKEMNFLFTPEQNKTREFLYASFIETARHALDENKVIEIDYGPSLFTPSEDFLMGYKIMESTED